MTTGNDFGIGMKNPNDPNNFSTNNVYSKTKNEISIDEITGEVTEKQVAVSVPQEIKNTPEYKRDEFSKDQKIEQDKAAADLGDSRLLWSQYGQDHPFRSEYGSDYTQPNLNIFRGVPSIMNPNTIFRPAHNSHIYLTSNSHLRILDDKTNDLHPRMYRLLKTDSNKSKILDKTNINERETISMSEFRKRSTEGQTNRKGRGWENQKELGLGDVDENSTITKINGRYVISEPDPNYNYYNVNNDCKVCYARSVSTAGFDDILKNTMGTTAPSDGSEPTIQIKSAFNGVESPSPGNSNSGFWDSSIEDTLTTKNPKAGKNDPGQIAKRNFAKKVLSGELKMTSPEYWKAKWEAEVQRDKNGNPTEKLDNELLGKFKKSAEDAQKDPDIAKCSASNQKVFDNPKPAMRQRFIDTPDIANVDMTQFRGVEPTLDNLCSKEVWGPVNKDMLYDYVDFLYCKWYNKIPNNRLITIRRFLMPVADTGLTHNYMKPKEIQQDDFTGNHVLARAVTWYGDETGNSLPSLTSFTTGYKWKPKTADIQKIFMKDHMPAENPMKEVGKSVGEAIKGIGTTVGTGNLAGQAISAVGSGITSLANLTDALSSFLNPVTNAQQSGFMQDLADFDPYENGDWDGLAFGPLNVIDTTQVRDRGIVFNNSLGAIKFEYQLRALGKINPRMAMLDIMSNLFLLCSTNAKFWGGGLRFFQWMPQYNLNYDMSQLIDSMKNGKLVTKDDSIWKQWLNYFFDTIGQGLDKLYPDKGGSTIVSNIKNSITGDGSIWKDEQKQKDLIENTKKLDTLTSSGGTSVGNLAGEGARYIINEAALKSLRTSFKNLIIPIKGILTGAPVGEWHLTVGNPFAPLMSIGNLICTGVKVSLSGSLGPDDFPEFLTAEISLEHGMPRDKGGIESIFNYGEGKMYYGWRDIGDYNTSQQQHRRRRFKFNLDDLYSAQNKFIQGNWSQVDPSSYTSKINGTEKGDFSKAVGQNELRRLQNVTGTKN